MAFNRFVILCVALALTASLAAAGSVHRTKGPKAGAPKMITGEETHTQSPLRGGGYPTAYSSGPGDSIGFTTYDYATNGSPNRNLISYGTTIALIRMGATTFDGVGTANRGSWRKCSFTGGNTWPGAMTKVEAIRTGWSNIYDLGGREGVVSHTGLTFNADASLCMNSWTSTTSGGAGQLWPRVTTTNGDDIHVVYGNANPPTAILYARSLDGGTTFDMLDVPIATAGNYVPDADAYDMTSDGTNIAVAFAGLFGNVLLVESADNGATWSETVVYDTDETGFTEENVPDGSCSVLYDNDGDAHVVWGTYYASGEGPDSLFYSTQVGIQHWSAASGVQQIGLPPDSLITFSLWRDGGVASSPDLAVDDDNNLFCVYSSFINEVDGAGNAYEHIVGVGSDDNGVTWSEAVDLTPGSGFDATFPSIADRVDFAGNVNMVYNCDPLGGNFIQGAHAQIGVAVMYLNIAKGDFFPICPDVTNVIARCISGGVVQARVVLSGSTIHSGKIIEFTVDEDAYTATIGDNGTSSRASITATAGLGTHTITLTDPAGCWAPLVRTCTTLDDAANAEWEADEAMWAAESQQGVQEITPAETKLLGNYPNPFNPSTTIRYALSVDSDVSVKVFNMLGQEVATLFDGFQKAGEQSVVWHGTNNAGHSVASGLYFYKLQVGNKVLTEKMLFMK
jgi:hypothetical protein